ncbi:MAG: protein translocase subunit SecD [Hyphomonadaceae bacterium]|nr:protein translocase subunit SecD [Hyphomonadaceae bacterium]
MLLRFPAWKVALVLVTLLLGVLACLPNMLSEQQRQQYISWLPVKPLSLGLDLKGGASILLEVDPVELRQNELRNLNRAVGEKLRETPLIPVLSRNPEGDAVVVKLRNATDKAQALERVRSLGKPPAGTIGVADYYVVTERADGAIEMRFNNAHFEKLQADALDSSIEAVRRRADNSGLVEPNIQKQGDSRVIVEVPGLNPAETDNLVETLTKTGVLTFNMVDPGANPADYTPGEPRNNRVALPDDSQAGAVEVIHLDSIIQGADLSGAQQDFDETGGASIAFQLHPAGAKRFGDETRKNVGQRFAIVLDDRIVSAPTIQSPIIGGSGRITGNFSIEEAEQMAIVLRSGALPAKLKVAERRVVDPSLGADSIRAGVTASVVGVGLVAVFMIAAYGLLGVFAVIALLLNMVLMIGVLSFFGATLTLPGIAGILLTMGMAVDYNVLIFERIREEKRAGRSPITSVEAGYDHAMATIIDANVTHVVAALVMFNLGSGPVRGFALTLVIGVITSFFTAVIVARWIMAMWLKTFRPKWIPI